MQSSERSEATPEAESGFRARDARTFTLLLVGQITKRGGHDGLCRVRNVSAGGLMADVVMSVEPEDLVRIDLRNGQSRSGVVRWVKKDQFGLQFDEPIADVRRFLAEERAPRADGLPSVRSPRLRAECNASLQLGGRPYPGTVLDISQGGARIATAAPAGRDRLLTLSIPGLPALRCVVRWAEAPDVGVSFLDQLSFAALAHWLDDPHLRFNRHAWDMVPVRRP